MSVDMFIFIEESSTLKAQSSFFIKNSHLDLKMRELYPHDDHHQLQQQLNTNSYMHM